MQLRKSKKEYAYENMEIVMEGTEDESNEDESDDKSLDVLELSQQEAVDIIQTLPDGFRKVLNLYVIDGYKHREIAELLNISVGTSKSQLNRARKLMKQKLIEHIKTKK